MKPNNRKWGRSLPPANGVAKVTFSVVSVCHSVCRRVVGPCTGSRLLDTFKLVQLGLTVQTTPQKNFFNLDLTVQGPPRQTCLTWTSLYRDPQTNFLNLDLNVPGPPPWTCSNLFIVKHVRSSSWMLASY